MFDHQQMLSTMASQRRIALTASADRWRLLARFRSGPEGVNAVFDVYCPGHGARVLLGSRRIERVQSVTHGVHLHWHCYCGTRGVLLLVDAPDVDVAVAA